MKFDGAPDPVEEAIFLAASELPAGAIKVFLDRACAGEEALRLRIEKLLRASKKATDFLVNDPFNPREDSLNEPAAPAEPLEPAGTMIGRYKLLQKIGEGGMGVVYMADQEQPVRRRVALKIIKLGMDTRAVVARFEAERQALALMDHPNIARILDGGATDSGRPYFVMELVQGVPITEYCDKNKLTIPARIQLFLRVCEAVQSAHQKGIIHRDLKPSNVMITLHDGMPVPKVIDFGVAKATHQKLTEKTLFTNYATLIGTPAYMSPEQAEMSGLDVDTRTDIYSLGVLLYELLTGTTPFPEKRLRSLGYGEMQKVISHEEPQRLPTRVSTLGGEIRTIVARNRGADALTLRKLLAGDLDWIVMKCLGKDRSRRYDTATALATDVERHLHNEPVLARPPRVLYRVQKFVRRNKALTISAASIAIGLSTALIVSTISYKGERAARKAAEEARGVAAQQRQLAQAEAARVETEALRGRRFQYASDMNLAHDAVTDGNLFRALQLLNRYRLQTNSKETDLRGWEWRYLWKNSQGDSSVVLGSHSNGVTAVGFLPGGKMAFSAGRDHLVRLWDLESRTQVGVLPHNVEITGAACSPDGRLIATSTEQNKQTPILIWDVATQQRVAEIAMPGSWVRPNSLAFSPDSTLLAFADIVPGVHVWSLAARKEIAARRAYYKWLGPAGLAFSPDGRTIAQLENEEGDIALWNIANRELVQTLKGHSWYVSGIAFSPDGQFLLSGGADRTVRIWDLPSGSERLTLTNYTVAPGAYHISSVRLSPSGKMFATAANGGGQRITVQSTSTGSEIIRLRGHTHHVTDLAFSPDERTLISGGMDDTVRLWNLHPADRAPDVRPIPPGLGEFSNGTSPALALSPNGLHLLTIFTNRTFSIWDMRTLTESPRYQLPLDSAGGAALARGGSTVGFISTNGSVLIWHCENTNTVSLAPDEDSSRAAFSEDGKLFAAGGWHHVSIWNVDTGKILVQIPRPKGDSGGTFVLRFTPDGQKLLAGFSSGLVMICDVTGREPVKIVRENTYQVNGVASLAGRNSIISASDDIRIVDLKTLKATTVLSPRPAWFLGTSVSTDARRLAVGGSDGLITIWDLDSQQEVATLAGHQRPIYALAFLPDGNTLVSVSVDQMRVWRAAPFNDL